FRPHDAGRRDQEGQDMRFDHRLRAGTLLLAVMLLVAACGGGDDTDDGGGETDSAETEAATPAADADDAADADADAGGAADADGDDAARTDAGGEGFSVGSSLPTGQNPWLNAIKDAAVAVIESAGGSVVVQDAQLDPNRQVSQLDELVNQGVDAIVLGPAQVPEAVQGALEGAQAAGIPTLALEYDYDVTDEPPPAPMDAQVLVDRRELARQVAAEVAGGSVVYVGLPFPVTGLDVFFAAFEEALEAEGATLLERVDNPTDNA